MPGRVVHARARVMFEAGSDEGVLREFPGCEPRYWFEAKVIPVCSFDIQG